MNSNLWLRLEGIHLTVEQLLTNTPTLLSVSYGPADIISVFFCAAGLGLYCEL